jgi:hypothetical protein
MIRSSEPREGEGDSPGPSGDVRARLTLLYEEGRLMADRFRAEVIEHGWHPFVPAEYEQVETVLVSLQRPGMRFLEWGSAMGVITIMADMLGFAAAGIEIDAELARIARELADRFGSAAEFATGSFLPAGYRWKSDTGDRRLGTIGQGMSGYQILRQPLEDFDVVFGYPWGGEEVIMHDVMRRYGSKDAHLLLQGTNGVEIYRDGKRVN